MTRGSRYRPAGSQEASTATSLAAFSHAGALPRSQRGKGQRQTGKRARSGCSKSSRPRRIRSSGPTPLSMRSGKYRRSACACRLAQLGQDGAIVVLNHRMHHALRVDHHLDAVGGHGEQPVSLDHFQALVQHGGRIDGNLAAHAPVRMGAGLRRVRHAGRPGRAHGTDRPKRSAAGGARLARARPGGRPPCGRHWKMALCSLSMGSIGAAVADGLHE